uniref:ABC transporter ATP-binding protein n=1 Tax=uncultured bacterium A1Q1_fos_15 TaxID=1256548 RepID=L7VTE4_9BACT|nr:ABC transporter ATP-binding protein [uncultured bacterium A1Q1_fos_15]
MTTTIQNADPIAETEADLGLSLSNVDVIVSDGTATRRVLSSISMRVRPGELVAVMGPSGSGKTTLLLIAAALIDPTSGSAFLAGEDLTRIRRSPRRLAALRRDRIGYVEQRQNLIASLSAAENVGLPLEFARMPTRDVRAAALAALDDVGLADRADTNAALLSGGEQQRVAIARALIGERQLLVADEPTAALDSATAEGIMRLIRRRADSGAIVLMATHNPEHAAWADRVIYLRDGEIASETAGGPPSID